MGERGEPGFMGPGENFAFGGNENVRTRIGGRYSSASTTAPEDGPESAHCKNHGGNVLPSNVLRSTVHPEI